MAHDDAFQVLQDTPLTVANSVVTPSPAAFPGLAELKSLSLNYAAAQIEYSQPYHLLFVREGGTAVHVIDLTTNTEISVEKPKATFTDLDTTFDGRYLYVADYGGTNIGYGTPSSPSYVHRFDASTRTWVTKQAPAIAYHIEGIDSDRFLLQEIDQWVDVTLNSWGATDAAPVTELSRTGFDYYGDMEYDDLTGRAIHGGSGNSSTEIHVVQVNGNSLTQAENTGGYGTAQGYGGSSVLSTDDKYFYYGRLQVDANNVRDNLNVFPETIYAGASGLAFGSANFYSADTGAALGHLPFTSSIYGVSDQTNEFWAFDSSTKTLHEYSIPYSVAYGVLVNDTDADADPLTAAVVAAPQHGQVVLNANGSFTYTPQAGYSGADSFTYHAADNAGNISNVATVALTVKPTDVAPVALPDSYVVPYQTKLTVGKLPVTAVNYKGLTQLATLNAPYSASQLEYASHAGMLFVRDGTSLIHVIDVANGLEISAIKPKSQFTDFDLSPDQHYLYAADYGGTNIGYGTPSSPSYVWRYDLVARQWEVKQAPSIAYRIEVVDQSRFLLLEEDQSADLTLNNWGATSAAPITVLSNGSAPYEGDIEYDPRTSMFYHGNSGLSSQEILAFKLVGDTIQSLGGTGTYGSAQGFGPQLTLSADGKYLFYGRLEVSPANVKTNLLTLPYTILGSAAGIAFSNSNNIYSAEDGEAIGTLGFSTSTMLASDDGLHLWAFDPNTKTLHFYRVTTLGQGVLANDTDAEDDALTATLVSGPTHGALNLNADGSFDYTPQAGYSGPDSFTYQASDGSASSGVQTVSLTVASQQPVTKPDAYSGTEDTLLTVDAAHGVLANDTDPDSPSITAKLVRRLRTEPSRSMPMARSAISRRPITMAATASHIWPPTASRLRAPRRFRSRWPRCKIRQSALPTVTRSPKIRHSPRPPPMAC